MTHDDLPVKLLLDMCVCSVYETVNKRERERERDEVCVLNERVSLCQKELDQ